MTQMTTQLQTVIDAAERAAEAIRFDAEEQARHHLAEAQRKADRLTAERVGLISELTDDLIRHASTVRDHSEQMIRALEDAISSVTTKLEQPALTESLDYSSGASTSAIPSQSAFGAAPAAQPESSFYTPPAATPAYEAPAAAFPQVTEPAPASAPVSTTPPAASLRRSPRRPSCTRRASLLRATTARRSPSRCARAMALRTPTRSSRGSSASLRARPRREPHRRPDGPRPPRPLRPVGSPSPLRPGCGLPGSVRTGSRPAARASGGGSRERR